MSICLDYVNDETKLNNPEDRECGYKIVLKKARLEELRAVSSLGELKEFIEEYLLEG